MCWHNTLFCYSEDLCKLLQTTKCHPSKRTKMAGWSGDGICTNYSMISITCNKNTQGSIISRELCIGQQHFLQQGLYEGTVPSFINRSVCPSSVVHYHNHLLTEVSALALLYVNPIYIYKKSSIKEVTPGFKPGKTSCTVKKLHDSSPSFYYSV